MTSLPLLKVIKEYKEGKSTRAIAKKYSYSKTQVGKVLKQNGIVMRKGGGRPGNQFARKYSCNDDYFETINTEPKAKWLGFLGADGGLEMDGWGITLGLNQKDRDHVVKFKEALNATNPIHDTERIHKDGKTRLSSRLTINSKKMHNDLISHGVPPRKTFILESPTGVPKHLIRHWIRGVFEGDGHIGIHMNSCGNLKKRASITGTRSVLEFIRGELEGIGRIHPDKSVFRFTIDVQDDIRKFAEYIYKDATIWMERKRRIFDFNLEKLNTNFRNQLNLEVKDLRLLIASGIEVGEVL